MGQYPLCKKCVFFPGPEMRYTLCQHPEAVHRTPDLVFGGETEEERLTCSSLRSMSNTRCGSEGHWFQSKEIAHGTS